MAKYSITVRYHEDGTIRTFGSDFEFAVGDVVSSKLYKRDNCYKRLTVIRVDGHFPYPPSIERFWHERAMFVEDLSKNRLSPDEARSVWPLSSNIPSRRALPCLEEIARETYSDKGGMFTADWIEELLGVGRENRSKLLARATQLDGLRAMGVVIDEPDDYTNTIKPYEALVVGKTGMELHTIKPGPEPPSWEELTRAVRSNPSTWDALLKPVAFEPGARRHIKPIIHLGPDIFDHPQENTVNIKTITYVNDQPINDLTNDRIYDLISKAEAELAKLKALPRKPKALDKRIEELDAGIVALIAAVDARDNA
jgi:hypothetical protein